MGKRSSMSDEGGRREKMEANEEKSIYGGVKGADCFTLLHKAITSHAAPSPSIYVENMSGGGRKRERHGEGLGRERGRERERVREEERE